MADYEESTSQRRKESKHAHKDEAKEDNVYHLDNNHNSISAVTPATMQ
jgi:hypothetical protein